MTRTRTLLVTTAIAFAMPLTSAIAQTASPSTRCGPVAWSTDKMAYISAPCVAGGEATVSPNAPAVGQAAPQAPAPQPLAPSRMVSAPMQEQAMAPGPNMAPMGDQCGALDAAAMKDEYGRKYNCRGDRVR